MGTVKNPRLMAISPHRQPIAMYSLSICGPRQNLKRCRACWIMPCGAGRGNLSWSIDGHFALRRLVPNFATPEPDCLAQILPRKERGGRLEQPELIVLWWRWQIRHLSRKEANALPDLTHKPPDSFGI